MLVLTRRVGETIVIGEDIAITVLAVRGERVRIGVSAPADVRVDRQEIHALRAALTPRGAVGPGAIAGALNQGVGATGPLSLGATV